MDSDETKIKTGEKTTEPLVPEGGWGWFVALGFSLSNISTLSFVACFGFLYEDFFEQLGHGTKGLALTHNVFLAMFYFVGTVLDVLIRKFSCRHVAVAGSLLFFVGYFLTTFATTMIHIVITYGVMSGIGLGLLNPSGWAMFSNYFVKRRVTVMGICQVSIGLANVVAPMVAKFLLEFYGFRGTISLIAAFSLHSVVGTALYQPVSWHMKNALVTEQEIPFILQPENRPSLVDKHDVLEVSKHSPTKPFNPETLKSDRDLPSRRSVWVKFANIFDLTFLKDFRYVSAVIGLAVAFMAEVNFQAIYSPFMSSIGYDKSETALGLTIYMGADVFSRLVFPIITSRFHLTNWTVFIVASSVGAIFKGTLMQVQSYPAVLTISAFCGFFRSPVVINPPLVIAEICPLDRLPAALGLDMVIGGVITLALGPFIGLIRDVSGSYPTCIYSLCGMQLLTIFLRGTEYLLTIYKNRNRTSI